MAEVYKNYRYKVAVCDDDKKSCTYYKDLINEICSSQGIDVDVQNFLSGNSLLYSIVNNPDLSFDLVFLDVLMPEIDGVSVAKKLRDEGFTGIIVFLTSSIEYALQAFDVRAFNYIVKDDVKNPDRLQDVLLDSLAAVDRRNTKYIMLNGIMEKVNIPIDSIRYFEVQKHICIAHYGVDDTQIEFSSSLDKLEALLAEYGFIRCYRSHLVNVAYVKSYTSKDITLDYDVLLPLGRKYRPFFDEYMKKKATINCGK